MGTLTLTLNDAQIQQIEQMAAARHSDPSTVVADALKMLNRTVEEDRQELYRLLEEGNRAILEGRCRPMDDVLDDISRDLQNGTL